MAKILVIDRANEDRQTVPYDEGSKKGTYVLTSLGGVK